MTPRLAEAVRAGGVLAPDHGGMCLDGVLPAAAEVLGLDPGPADLPGRGAAARFGLAPATRVCVVLVDGMGLELVAERKAHVPYLRGRLAEARALTSSVPSTTATTRRRSRSTRWAPTVRSRSVSRSATRRARTAHWQASQVGSLIEQAAPKPTSVAGAAVVTTAETAFSLPSVPRRVDFSTCVAERDRR